jgi:glycosyltransferase involved in cell wall biosynthesis
MKILQVINNLATGGAEKLLLESLPFYVERGINIDVLVLNGSSYPFLEALNNLNCCNVYSLGLHSVYNPIHIFKIIPYLKKYDIVHVHLFPGQYWVVLAKLISLVKVKLVFTEHCTTNRRLENWLFKILDRQIYRGYQKIVCITPEINDILKEHTNLSDSVFSLIENGVNLKGIREAKQTIKNEINEKIDQSDILLIQVAGFRPQKDHFTLIEALNFLPKNIKLILVGDGVLRKACEDLTIKLHLSDRVIFLGLRMDVPQLLKTADIIVLSSKYEGLSLSCIEGMASGRPFIASDVPGLSEVVKDAGILFEQGNSEELAEKILELLRDKNYYDRVVESCQIRAAQYDIQTMIDKHIALYESLF